MIRLSFLDSGDVLRSLDAADKVVAAGGVVLIPTESHYGLGVDPWQRDAVARIFALKGRPGEQALPVVCSDWEQVDSLVEIPAIHRVKLARVWPAALTVIAPCKNSVAASSTDTLAVRIPDHDRLRALLYRVGPLTATSANRHGEPPCPRVEMALESLNGTPDLVLDGGNLAGGQVSTVLDLSGDEAAEIRSGPVVWDEPFSFEKWILPEG